MYKLFNISRKVIGKIRRFKIFADKIRDKKAVSQSVLLKLIYKSIVDLSDFNYLKSKVLSALHLYTGYSIINIFARPLSIFKKPSIENLYNRKLAYLKFFMDNCVINKNPVCLKRNRRGKIMEGNKIRKFEKAPFLKLEIKKYMFKKHHTVSKFLKSLPFYVAKPFRDLIKTLLNLLVLKNQSLEIKYQLIRDSFEYLYNEFDGHFYRAFKIYKLLLTEIFKKNFLNVEGIRIVVKGRFGKVRKQIQKLVIGSLNINTFIKKINYYKSLLITQRGSYGFHIWFAQKDNIKSYKGNTLTD
jgi:hypothetical protein|nr:hypothetical protein [Actinophrys sol]